MPKTEASKPDLLDKIEESNASTPSETEAVELTPEQQRIELGKQNIRRINAEFRRSRQGFFRHAYTMVETERGQFVPVHLENVTAERAYPADPSRRDLTAVDKGIALNRLISGIRRRANTRRGWLPRKKQKK